MNMDVRNRDQGANERTRTWTVVNFFNLCVLDFPYMGGLQRLIERFVDVLMRVHLHCQGSEGEGCHRVFEG